MIILIIMFSLIINIYLTFEIREQEKEIKELKKSLRHKQVNFNRIKALEKAVEKLSDKNIHLRKENEELRLGQASLIKNKRG